VQGDKLIAHISFLHGDRVVIWLNSRYEQGQDWLPSPSKLSAKRFTTLRSEQYSRNRWLIG